MAQYAANYADQESSALTRAREETVFDGYYSRKIDLNNALVSLRNRQSDIFSRFAQVGQRLNHPEFNASVVPAPTRPERPKEASAKELSLIEKLNVMDDNIRDVIIDINNISEQIESALSFFQRHI